MNQADASPLVSVLLPVYNAEATLPACLRSIQRQTELRWECILVDDGSTDATAAIASAAVAGDPRWRIIRTPHRGLVPALQTGLAHCGGRYVARMDADDVMHRQRLAVQVRCLDGAPDLAAAGTQVRVFPRRHLRDGLRAYERWLNGIDSPRRVREDAFVECPIVHPTLMIRTGVLREFGYRAVDWAEDYDLVLRLLARGHEIDVVPQRLLGWRDSPTRLTRTAAPYAAARFPVCKAAFLASGFLAGRDCYVLWGHGPTGRALRRALAHHAKRPSHIVEVHPRRLGQLVHGAPVIPPDDLRRISDPRIVVGVAGAPVRQRIRDYLAAMGLHDTVEFVCAG